MKIKRILCALLVVFSLVATFPMAAFAETASTSASISATNATTISRKLIKGQKLKLKVKNYKGKIKWSTSKKSVATVNSKGVVTAKKAGKATITAKLSNGQKLKCKVTVIKTAVGMKITGWPSYGINMTFYNYSSLTVKNIRIRADFYDIYGNSTGWSEVTVPITIRAGGSASYTLTNYINGTPMVDTSAYNVRIQIQYVYFSNGLMWRP